MITRESFQKIRNKKQGFFSLRVRLIFLIMIELIVILLLATWMNTIVHDVLKLQFKVPRVLELIILSVVIGSGLTAVLGKAFFEPVQKLRRAMEKVADGDFNVQIDTASSAKEIQEVFAGFNLMTQELRATEILQTDFVSNVSHEFKTPINAIEGYATLLQDSDNASPEDQTEYVEKILLNTRRLSNLVSDILLLSKIDNQAIQSKQTKFRLDEQIRQSIVLLEPEWVKKDIEFDVEMERIELTGNESLLHHVWYNLISNAIKFNPPGGVIRIVLARKKRQVIFEIEDSGPGISENAKKRIFEKFSQEDSSHKEEGNGLGLALVKQILNVSAGEISVENLSGGGCRFTVILKDC